MKNPTPTARPKRPARLPDLFRPVEVLPGQLAFAFFAEAAQVEPGVRVKEAA